MIFSPLLQRCASAPVTVAAFIAVAAGALLVLYQWTTPTPAMIPGFVLLLVNLVAALICKPKLRVNPPLLLFHLALLLLLLLFIAARLVYYKGGVLLTEGDRFEGQVVTAERGLLHQGEVNALRFENLGFANAYLDQRHPGATYSELRWWDAQGQPFTSVIGDDRPLVLDGFRIYTTGMRGFSPVFEWRPASGGVRIGSAQLSDSNDERFAPANQWQLPDGPEVWVMLDTTPEQPIAEVLWGEQPVEAIQHRLILRSGEQRLALAAGDRVQLEGGSLAYLGLSTWVGYAIIYEPLTPWMAATVIIGVLSLILFYLQTLFRRPAKPDSPAPLLHPREVA